jgi:hypothetical protein
VVKLDLIHVPSMIDWVWKCLIHNMNYVTARANLDCTIDKTTWGFSGYSGEAGGRLLNKPVSMGESPYYYGITSSLMLLTLPCIAPKVDNQLY